MPGIATEEIVDLLRRVGNGEVVPRLANPERTWRDTYCGEVDFLVDGWQVAVFNDCDDFDYIDSAIAPDGRTGKFEDWAPEFTLEHPIDQSHPADQIQFQDDDCYRRMVAAFENAK